VRVETESGRRYLVSTGTDISRRRKLEQDIVQVSESERQRIGQELHDTLASDLVAAAMKMDNLRSRLQKQYSKNTEILSRLESIETSVRQASERARSLSHLLAAGKLEPSELSGALAELVQTYRDASDVDCQLELPDQTLSVLLDSPAAGHLYRIAQEAVRNAVSHGHPNHVDVRIEVVVPSQSDDADDWPPADGDPQERWLLLQVRDDGTGLPDTVSTDLHSEFPPGAKPHGNELDEGIGLRLMFYRADLMDAMLKIDSADEKGTVVRCAIPVK
jgi:signal transduction histidine kinase